MTINEAKNKINELINVPFKNYLSPEDYNNIIKKPISYISINFFIIMPGGQHPASSLSNHITAFELSKEPHAGANAPAC